MGDVTSSLAVAVALREKGHRCLFLTNKDAAVEALLSDARFTSVQVEDAGSLGPVLQQHRCDIAVLNQLNTPLAEAGLFRERAGLMVTIDDTGEAARLADLRFNVLYPTDDSLSDPSFIGLSAAFRQKHAEEKSIMKQPTNILVTQGGSDTYGFTPRIVRALNRVDAGIAVRVVLGPKFAHEKELADALRASTRPFELLRAIRDLSEPMMQADLAVTAGGNTLFELACLGVPTVVVCGERFEVATARRLDASGFGLNLGFGGDVDEGEIAAAVMRLLHDPVQREAMSRCGKRLVDGNGASRMAEVILSRALAGAASRQQREVNA